MGLLLLLFIKIGESAYGAHLPSLPQAVIDSARIIGFPASRAAQDWATKIQLEDIHISYLSNPTKPVSWRRLFFRGYFSDI